MSSMSSIYNMRYLGSTPISKFTTGFSVLQKPLHDLYVSYLTPKGQRQPVASRLALTDRGIILTIQGNDSFYSMREVLLWEAVHWVRVQMVDKKFVAAFEPIDPDRHRGMDNLFSKLDNQYKYLTTLNHEPLLACVLRRTSGPKAMDVHAFVCSSEAEAFSIVASIARMQQQFQSQEERRIADFQYIPSKESVRRPSGSSAGQLPNAKGSKSQRQPKSKPQHGDGEITMEELFRLADMALADPVKSSAPTTNEAPPFRMGESWGAKETQHGVRRSQTFNDGQKRNAAPESRAKDQNCQQSNVRLEPMWPAEAPRGAAGAAAAGAAGAVAWKQLQDVRYYENVSVPNGQPRTYENLGAPGSIPTDNSDPRRSPVAQPRQHQQQQLQQQQMVPRHGSLDERDAARMNGQQQQPQQMIDPLRRKSMPPESLRMVIAESRMANKRVSVLPGVGTDFCISSCDFNISGPGDSRAPAIVDIQFDHDQQPLQPNPSPKPVAMVQPRKVSGVKVLPEPVHEGFQLHKVSQPGKGLDESRKEQYQRGDAGNRNFTRSMFELNNANVTKPTTPQASKKYLTPDQDPARKVVTNAEPEPARKSSNPEAVVFDGRGSKAVEKPAGERGKKDAEIEAFALNINFYKPPTNTLSPHGTNFESALGYFP